MLRIFIFLIFFIFPNFVFSQGSDLFEEDPEEWIEIRREVRRQQAKSIKIVREALGRSKAELSEMVGDEYSAYKAETDDGSRKHQPRVSETSTQSY